MSATPAASIPESPRAEARYNVPSLAYRVTIGSVRGVVYVILLVVLPVALLNFLASLSIPFPITVEAEEIYGLVVAILLAARYVLRPTRAYGPLCMAVAAATFLFFALLLFHSTYDLATPQSAVDISITFTDVVLILLLVPTFTFFAGVVTTIEDARSPGERLEFDYPP